MSDRDLCLCDSCEATRHLDAVSTLTFTPAEGRAWAEFLAMQQRTPALIELRARILAAMGGEES